MTEGQKARLWARPFVFVLPHKANLVMAGLVPAIHVFLDGKKDVDARLRPGMTVETLVRFNCPDN